MARLEQFAAPCWRVEVGETRTHTQIGIAVYGRTGSAPLEVDQRTLNTIARTLQLAEALDNLVRILHPIAPVQRHRSGTPLAVAIFDACAVLRECRDHAHDSWGPDHLWR